MKAEGGLDRLAWVKQCKCHPATASGPRIVTREVMKSDHVKITASEHYKVCDVCDTPWKLERTDGE